MSSSSPSSHLLLQPTGDPGLLECFLSSWVALAGCLLFTNLIVDQFEIGLATPADGLFGGNVEGKGVMRYRIQYVHNKYSLQRLFFFCTVLDWFDKGKKINYI